MRAYTKALPCRHTRYVAVNTWVVDDEYAPLCVHRIFVRVERTMCVLMRVFAFPSALVLMIMPFRARLSSNLLRNRGITSHLCLPYRRPIGDALRTRELGSDRPSCDNRATCLVARRFRSVCLFARCFSVMLARCAAVAVCIIVHMCARSGFSVSRQEPLFFGMTPSFDAERGCLHNQRFPRKH